MNKKQLAVLLSKLKTFDHQNINLEQYQTDSDITAEVLWFAFMQKDIQDKIIADLGCGNGIFGLGALILGAKKVYFVDIDKLAIKLAKQNKKFLESQLTTKFNAVFINKNVKDFKKKVNLVIQNPPFGVKKTHHDKLFLITAMEIAPVIYSFHKIESKQFIEKFTKDNNFRIKNFFIFNFPLKKTLKFHRKDIHFVKVGCWKIEKKV